ncbi:nitrite reductase small subunit NirD [Mucilaginibacter koreensis]
MPWYDVGEASQFESDHIFEIRAGKSNLCLIKCEEQLVATQLKCPHAGAWLSNGWCKDGKLVCPLHRYSYDLQSGRGSAGQGDYIEVYPVKVENGRVFVNVNSFTDTLKQLLGYGTQRN